MFSGTTTTSGAVDLVFLIIIGICVALLLLVTFLMVYFVIKFNRHRHPVPRYIKDSYLLEALWTIVPTLIVLVMFYYGWKGYRELKFGAPEDALRVKVTGRMWSWEFEYPNGKKSDKLYVPVHQPTKVMVYSADVLHAFFVPAFRIKQDAVPGMENDVWFTPTRTGTYDILCAEYCGLQHSAMLSEVIVMEPKEFQQWYESPQDAVAASEPLEQVTDAGPESE